MKSGTCFGSTPYRCRTSRARCAHSPHRLCVARRAGKHPDRRSPLGLRRLHAPQRRPRRRESRQLRTPALWRLQTRMRRQIQAVHPAARSIDVRRSCRQSLGAGDPRARADQISLHGFVVERHRRSDGSISLLPAKPSLPQLSSGRWSVEAECRGGLAHPEVSPIPAHDRWPLPLRASDGLRLHLAGAPSRRNSAECGRDAGRHRAPNASACNPKTCTSVPWDAAREWRRSSPAREGADWPRGSVAAAGRHDPRTRRVDVEVCRHNVVIASQHDGRSGRVKFSRVGGQGRLTIWRGRQWPQ